jgi:hypothetical protein
VPRLARIDGVEIVLWPNDHPPPHFHAIFAEHEARLSIETGDVLSGGLPKAKLKAVHLWLDENRDSISRRWSDLRAQQDSGRSRR